MSTRGNLSKFALSTNFVEYDDEDYSDEEEKDDTEIPPEIPKTLVPKETHSNKTKNAVSQINLPKNSNQIFLLNFPTFMCRNGPIGKHATQDFMVFWLLSWLHWHKGTVKYSKGEI
jgi:hypothetical protein